jgi:FMN phosphatase YigB (HAD superfamily)
MAILISFDIDGTLEVGDPPGPLTIEMVRIVQDKGFLIGSCSDRPPSSQRSLWEGHKINVDFAVAKHMLSGVKSDFTAEAYYHIGDREDLDRQNALRAGFEFLWPDEAAAQPWFLPDG